MTNSHSNNQQPQPQPQPQQPQQPTGTLADLTACVRKTTGEIPPPLVGASATVLGSAIYVFGGRLVPTRMMIADMYRLDLRTLVWHRIWQPVSSKNHSPSPTTATTRTRTTTNTTEPVRLDPKGKSRALDINNHNKHHRSQSSSSNSSTSSTSSSSSSQSQSPSSSSASPPRSVSATSRRSIKSSKSSSKSSPLSEHRAEAIKGASIPPAVDPSVTNGPCPRYFHSAEAWDHRLVIFGGMGYNPDHEPSKESRRPLSQDIMGEQPASDAELDLRVLDDVIIFDTLTLTWSFPAPTVAPEIPPPSPRYAHLSCLTSELGYEGPITDDDYLPPVTNSNPDLGMVRTLNPNRRQRRNLLTLLGGQDIKNCYIGEINVLDLDSMQWIEGRRWERHCGTYRSVACTASLTVRQGDRFELNEEDGGEDYLRRLSWSEKPSVERPEPIYVYSNFNFNYKEPHLIVKKKRVRRDLELVSFPTTPPPPPATASSTGHYTTVHSLSHTMSGSLPFGLRFPTGVMIGNHMIVSGTWINQEGIPDRFDCFAIWALDLSQANHKHVAVKVPHGQKPEISAHNSTNFGAGKVVWQRIDPGRVMMSGSWSRAVAWGNCLVVLGDKDRDTGYDYHHRQINFVDLAFIDLEPFSIYQPPFSNQSYVTQGFSRDTSLKSAKLGLKLLTNPSLADMEIVCVDGGVIPVNRQMIEDRWPWFRAQLDEFRLKATRAHVAYQDQMRKYSASKSRVGVRESTSSSVVNGAASNSGGEFAWKQSMHSSSTGSLPPFEKLNINNPSTNSASSTISSPAFPSSSSSSSSSTQTIGNLPPITLPEPYQITPRALYLPHPTIVAQAVLEYLFTTDLVTPLHQMPAVLTSMLIFATTYKLEHLRMLTVHALHRFLNPTGSSGSRHSNQFGAGGGSLAALIYEAATLSGCMALQIRSLKVIIAAQQAKQYGNAKPLQGGSSSATMKIKSSTESTINQLTNSTANPIRGYNPNAVGNNLSSSNKKLSSENHSGKPTNFQLQLI